MLIYNGIVINLKALLIEPFTNFMQNCQFVKTFFAVVFEGLHMFTSTCTHLFTWLCQLYQLLTANVLSVLRISNKCIPKLCFKEHANDTTTSIA